ncbi:DUF2391 domain-containing protein [Halomarina halobia]|uniref:DUF2391 domain-containing protein n=1 Tax=Halomarina halobia TaxID=3033386 RepID=A0ABD6AB07_9EURY|nr:DUF2391 domain-containing protein [Halomarina sp. PSR21]
MVGPARRFKTADIAQQLVGGFLLAGPFVVTEEVWVLARSMSVFQGVLTAAIVGGIGYGALYKADDRDPDREVDIGGVPVRFLSLMAVSFGAVLLLALAFDAPTTFLSGLGVERARWPFVTAKAVSVGAVFSVVGAATADSVF